MSEQMLWVTVQVLAALAGIVGVPLAAYLARFFWILRREIRETDQLHAEARRRLSLSARRAALELDERAE